MKQTLLLSLLSFLLAGRTVSQDLLVRESGPLSPAEEKAALSVPEGFTMELFASEPMINKPINLAVDARGRVWVSSTVEYPYAAEKDRWSDEFGSSVRDSRDAIKILEDTDGDGVADRVTDFVDGLNIPTGVLPWHRPEDHDGCIAWSIPNIWYFADTTGDGKCDKREVLFGPLGYEKDTHGMCSSFRLGADGWVYATHGFNNTSHLLAKDGSELELHSGNVFRFRPDGSRVEIWSRGQVNPFGLCFDGRGNLYSADCHSAPVYQLLRGAHYPSFGKPHDGLGFAPAMITHTHGSTGIAGIVFVDGGIWGEEWDDEVLIGNPVTSRINRDRIEFAGTTPVARERPDLVTSRDPWFRPVDLTLAGGALYVADFYNRIIGHYEVPLDHPGRDRERGRIWRVVKGAGGVAVSGQPKARKAVRGISDPIAALADADPWVRRAAASAIQDSPSVEAVVALRSAARETVAADTHLHHALQLAMRECLRLPGAFRDLPKEGEIGTVALAVESAEAAGYLLSLPDDAPGLERDFLPRRRRHVGRWGSERALDQIIATASDSRTDATEVGTNLLEIAEGLEERDGILVNERWIAAATKVVGELLGMLSEGDVANWTAHSLPAGAAGSARDGSVWEVQIRKSAEGREIAVLSSLVRSSRRGEEGTGVLRSRDFDMPERLRFPLCGHRGSPTAEAHEKNYVSLRDVVSGEELFRAFPPRSDVARVVEWGRPDLVGRKVSLEVVDGDEGKAYAWLAVGEVEGVSLPFDRFEEEIRVRQLLVGLAERLVRSAPIDLRDKLAAFLPVSPPVPSLAINPVEEAEREALIARRVSSFEPKEVDATNGERVFRQQCSLCHRIGGEGALIGPQLDGIGTRGIARLVEDILEPNRNVDAHFRLTVLTLSDGSTRAGFAVSGGGKMIQLLDAAGQTQRIAESEIKTRETSALSLMPSTWGTTLSEADFRDLVGWLLKQR